MKVLALVALLACGAFAAEEPQCQAPNGGGLQPVFAEFVSMIPIEQVLEVLLTSMTSDPETQAVMEYLSSNEFFGIVTMVQSQPAFQSLMQFACQDLYMDAAYYFNVMAGIFGFPEVRAAHPRATFRAGGFRGLLQDLLALVPVDDVRALFQEKLATDYYLQLAMQKINSDEFGSIIEALQANSAFSDLKNRLSGLGIDVALVIETISKIFKP